MGRTAHATVQAVGMTLMTVMAVVYVLLSLLVFDAGGELGPMPVIVVVFGLATWAAWRYDNVWVRILGVVASVAVAGSVFFMAFGIFQPFSPLEFILGLLLVVGFVMAVVWGVMAIVAGLRGRVGATRTDRVVAVWLPVAIGVLSVVSVAGFFLTRTSVSAAEASGATEVDMVDFSFEPGDTTVTDGRLLLSNLDPAGHDFTIEAFDIHTYVGPGSQVIVDLGDVPPGTYDYVCSLHTDPTTGEGMAGQVTISG